MTVEDDKLKRIQSRIDAEDSLLHSRTTIFLLTNGLLLATLGIETYGLFRLMFCFLGILVTIVWILVGWQCWRKICELHREHGKSFPDAIEVEISQRAAQVHSLIRITPLLGRWLPLIFLIAWILSSILLFKNG
jgi:hypothetical protein